MLPRLHADDRSLERSRQAVLLLASVNSIFSPRALVEDLAVAGIVAQVDGERTQRLLHRFLAVVTHRQDFPFGVAENEALDQVVDIGIFETADRPGASPSTMPVR